MGRQAKTGLGLAIVVLLALLAFLRIGPLVGLLVLLAGAGGLVVVLRRTAGLGGGGRRDRGESFLEASIGTLDAPAAPSNAPTLQPWTPPEGLQPWTPPEDIAEPEVTEEPAVDLVDELVDPDELERAWEGTSAWGEAEVEVDANPLDELERLDDVDVIAEVERIEARESSTLEFDEVEVVAEPEAPASSGLFSVPAPINEDVRSDDEIMAASQATELSVAEDNSELAKLLAKVQARLAAYE